MYTDFVVSVTHAFMTQSKNILESVSNDRVEQAWYMEQCQEIIVPCQHLSASRHQNVQGVHSPTTDNLECRTKVNIMSGRLLVYIR